MEPRGRHQVVRGAGRRRAGARHRARWTAIAAVDGCAELTAARRRRARSQPGLRATRVVGGKPSHPDIPAEVDVFVLVDVPAVHRPALRDGAVRELRIVLQRRQRRSDGGGADGGGRAADQIAGAYCRATPSAASVRLAGSARPRPPRTTSPPRGTGRRRPARLCRSGAAAREACFPPVSRTGPGAWSRRRSSPAGASPERAKPGRPASADWYHRACRPRASCRATPRTRARELSEGHRADQAGSGRGPVQPAVMHAYQMAVAGQPHIAFHAVGALFECEIVGGQRMFGPSGRSAAMGNNKGMPGEHLLGPRHTPMLPVPAPSTQPEPADAGSAGRSGRSGSTTTQRCAGRSTGFRSNPSKTRATAATVAAASR